MFLLNLGILFFGFFLGWFFWDKISLQFSNHLEVIGPADFLRFNPATNIWRYLLFIFMPALLLLLIFGLVPAFRKQFSPKIVTAAGGDRSSQNKNFRRIISFFSYLILIAFPISTSLVFFSKNWYLGGLDFFHDGQALSPAFNYLKTGLLWRGSYLTRGVFNDILVPFFTWKLFGHQTIGAYRFCGDFMLFLLPWAVSFLFISLSLAIKFEKKEWPGSIILSQLLLAVYLLTFIKGQIFYERDLPVVIGLVFLILAVALKNHRLFFVTGLFSSLAYAYSVDRGAYFSVTILMVAACLYFFPLEAEERINKKHFLFLISGLLAGWFFFVLIFGWLEFKCFLSNTWHLYRTIDLQQTIVYPRPGVSFLHTLPLVLIAIQIYGLVFYFLKDYRWNFDSRSRFYLHLVLTTLSILYFRSGLNRPDQPHIVYVLSFAFLGIGFYLWLIIMEQNNRLLNLGLIILLFVLNGWVICKNFSFLDINKIRVFPKVISKYVQLNDSYFLTPAENSAVERMKEIFKDEKYFFSLSQETIFPYLLKKPSGDKNYNIWFCCSKLKRNELIADFERCQPKFILFGSKHVANFFDGLNNYQRFPEVYKYVLSCYVPYETIGGNWEIYRRK